LARFLHDLSQAFSATQQRLSQGQWRYATEVVAFSGIVHYKKWRIRRHKPTGGRDFATGSLMHWHSQHRNDGAPARGVDAIN
jgi:hypothetical protein